MKGTKLPPSRLDFGAINWWSTNGGGGGDNSESLTWRFKTAVRG